MTALPTEHNFDGDQPNVNVTVNKYCSDAYTYKVTVSFGVRQIGSSSGCDFKQFISETLVPGDSEIFNVNKSVVILTSNYEYCVNVSLQEATERKFNEEP